MRPVFGIAIALLGVFPIAAQEQDPISRLRARAPEHEPFKIFDNLYYVGINFVSVYLVPTSEGLILIDAAYDENVDYVLDGVKKMGFDPANIKYIFVTHWHGDHFAGADRIHKVSGATVGMVKEDWDSLPEPSSIPDAKRMVIKDGDAFTLGDTTLKFYQTPGHTLGVLSIEYTLYDNGKAYKGFTFGGTGMNFSGVPQSEMYIASAKRILAMEGIQVNVPNHASMGDVFGRAERLAHRKPNEPHPFVDPEGFTAFMKQNLANAEEKLVAEQAKARE